MKRHENFVDPFPRARQLLWIGLFALPAVAFTWIAAPGFMNPIGYERPWYVLAVPLLGFLGILIGNVLIRRINSDTEDDERSWRYRDF
jgi:hypothetical protein